MCMQERDVLQLQVGLPVTNSMLQTGCIVALDIGFLLSESQVMVAKFRKVAKIVSLFIPLDHRAMPTSKQSAHMTANRNPCPLTI